jgi:predicted HTH domain antitoxin
MGSVTIEIPAEFAKSFGENEEEVARNARLELAVGMYREGKWSTGRAAEFLGIPLMKFMDLLRDRQVPHPYTHEMLEQDIRHACRSV